MTLLDLFQTLTAALTIIGSAAAIYISISRSGVDKRKTTEEGTKADADASLIYGNLAEQTAKRLAAVEAERAIDKKVSDDKIAVLERQVAQLNLNQDRMVRYTAYLISIIDRLTAQLVSHEIEPVTRPISLEEFK